MGQLPVSWSQFVDRGSGTAGYAPSLHNSSAAAASDAGGAAGVPVGMANSALLATTLSHAASVFTTVRAWDVLGNSRVCASDGALFDATPPDVSQAVLTSELGRLGLGVGALEGSERIPIQRERRRRTSQVAWGTGRVQILISPAVRPQGLELVGVVCAHLVALPRRTPTRPGAGGGGVYPPCRALLDAGICSSLNAWAS